MVIVSAVLWGLYGSFVTVLTSMGLSQNALVFLRMFATSIPVGLLMLATDRSAFRVRPADIPLFIANGVLSLLFFTFCYTSAIKVTKIATAAALLYTAPAILRSSSPRAKYSAACSQSSAAPLLPASAGNCSQEHPVLRLPGH